jgi:hypothetical protein
VGDEAVGLHGAVTLVRALRAPAAAYEEAAGVVKERPAAVTEVAAAATDVMRALGL